MTTMRRVRQKSLPRTQHSTHLLPTKLSGPSTESEGGGGRSTPTLSRSGRSSDATRSSESASASGGEHRRAREAKDGSKDGSKDTTQRRWQKFGRKDKNRNAMSPNQRHMVRFMRIPSFRYCPSFSAGPLLARPSFLTIRPGGAKRR